MTVLLLISCVAWTTLGILFVCWIVRRSLPVPDGAFAFIRFFFWWGASAFVGWVVYLIATLLVTPLEIRLQLMDNHEAVAALAGGLPVLVGLGYGVYLQLFAPHRSRVDP